MSLRKNVASQVLTFCLVNATTGAALTGASVTTKVTIDGTQGAGAGTVTELGTGQYKYVPTQSETNGASVGFCFTATNAVPVNLHCFTTSNDPATVLPTAATTAAQVRTELTTELAHITLAKKLLKNRTETNPATGVMTVYDDDGTTPLYTANIYADVAGATLYAGTAAVNRRDALA